VLNNDKICISYFEDVMKNLTNSDELDQTIEKLDNLLIEGHLKYTTQRQGYFQNKDKEGFSVDTHRQETTNILNEWFRATVRIIEAEIKEKHHLFHFLQHHGGSLVITGVPIELSNTLISFEYYLYALEDIILRLEEKKNLVVRQEIAEIEYQTDVLYKITYSEHTREIKINNVVLARLQSDSKNVNFFEYVYSHQNQQIAITAIEEHTAYKLADNVHDMLRDLGFKGNIRKIFFPIATKTKVMFVNPITKEYAIKNDLPVIELPKTTRQNEK
jgi:hypothetical protein